MTYSPAAVSEVLTALPWLSGKIPAMEDTMHLTRCECSGHHRKRIPRPLWARLLFPGRIMLLCDRCGKRQLVPL